MTDNIDIPGFYATHVNATQGPRGRPIRGISCYYKPSIGKILNTYQDEDTIVINSENLTLIGHYFEPRTPIEDIISTIMTALAQANPGRNIIVAGDMNCRIDLADHRSDELLNLMKEEGFKLLNKRDNKTYFAHNGSSTIDLIFYKGPELNLTEHRVCYNTAGTPLKKHCPIIASFSIHGQTKPTNHPIPETPLQGN